jgi:hypothetical protein
MVVDPMADKFPAYSPYIYCENNPSCRIDPDGKQSFTINKLSFFRTVVQQQPLIKSIEFAQKHPIDAIGITANNTADGLKIVSDVSFKASLLTLTEPHAFLPLSTTSAVSTVVAVPFRVIAWKTGYAEGEDVLYDAAEAAVTVLIVKGEKAISESLLKTGKGGVTKHVSSTLERLGVSKAGRFASESLENNITIGTNLTEAGASLAKQKVFQELRKEEEVDKTD